MKCERCESDYADSYFKDEYTNEIICLDCLLDGCDHSTITHYSLDGIYLGSDDDIQEVIESICDYTNFEEVEEDKQYVKVFIRNNIWNVHNV